MCWSQTIEELKKHSVIWFVFVGGLSDGDSIYIEPIYLNMDVYWWAWVFHAKNETL